jgi:hypothetical protein
MLNTSALNVVEGLGTQLMCAGDVMGLLGGLPLTSIDGVRMGRPVAAAGRAQASGNVGAVDCASGSGECGIGADCGGGQGCCGVGGDCAGN